MEKETSLSDKIWDEGLEEMIGVKAIKEAVKRLKAKFKKLSQRTKGGLDEFFDEIDAIFGDKLV